MYVFTHLHHFLVVVINNNTNTIWGKSTSSSPDGRKNGEPLMQPHFTFEILRRLKEEGVHTALDTSGYIPLAITEQTLSLTDLYLLDYKVSSREEHFDLVGGDIQTVLNTLDFLIDNKANVILRCPIIPGVNDKEKHLETISAMVKRYPSIEAIEILPWHTMGKGKYKKLGIPIDPRLPKDNASQESIEYYRKFLIYPGLTSIVIND
jgi:pyruvate-formate lyase-activating enzyme